MKSKKRFALNVISFPLTLWPLFYGLMVQMTRMFHPEYIPQQVSLNVGYSTVVVLIGFALSLNIVDFDSPLYRKTFYLCCCFHVFALISNTLIIIVGSHQNLLESVCGRFSALVFMTTMNEAVIYGLMWITIRRYIKDDTA